MSPARKLADDRGRHPIGVVAQRTGLSQDVLRAWERRYGVVRPTRGPDGERLYGDADIERLRLLDAAVRGGRRIGQVARLSTAALATLVARDEQQRPRAEPHAAPDADPAALVRGALDSARALDAAALDATLRRAAALLGVPPFLERVAVPLLRTVGDEWHAGRLTTAQEHLASSVVHDIAAGAMRTVARGDGAPRIVVATPAGERHVIGAALAGAAAAVEGWNVIYLGADLPAAEIARAAIEGEARLVAVSIVYLDSRQRVIDELGELRSLLPPRVRLLAGGAGAALLAAELSKLGVEVAPTLATLSEELRRER
jgi:DNA-binding transcriptional MerR regulator/methylmalonyl-CoA mutase cobalamin-binding subunit